ncbi:MAG TPA: hypothetical protein VE173_05075, partial [Longimicrobiales bacterium]|nr:hypothetical protein [Longimicrobiales bacterium]
MERFFSDGSRMVGLLPGRALAGGGDFVLRFGSGQYEISGFAGGSRIHGTPEAIERRQRSSRRYLQRPDASHVVLDPGRTTLMGWTAGFRAGRVGGVGLRWNAELSAASPGFELVDAGYQPRVDVVEARGRLSYEIRDGQGALRQRTFGLAFDAGWNFGGTRRITSPSVFWSSAWSNRWRTYVEVGVNTSALSDDLTRGGPLMATPRSWWTHVRLFPRRTGNTWWEIEGYGLSDAVGGWTASLNGGVTVQAGSHLGLSLYTGGLLGDDSRQYLQRTLDGPEATFGARYVFSSLERSELFAQLRAELAFAPDAVLTLYAEPFVSSGRTHGFGELTAARAGSLRTYGTD